MAIRVGKHKLVEDTPLELSSVSDRLQQIDFLSVTSLSEADSATISFYSTTSDTGTYVQGDIRFLTFNLIPGSTKIFTKNDFPIGDLNASNFGNHATDDRFYIEVTGGGGYPVIIHYTVTDAGVTADYTTEQIQDIVGAMFTGNTETNIAATYEDSDGTIDLVSVDTNTTYSAFDNDNAGLVPDPGSTGTTTKYLREDGSFQVPPDTVPTALTRILLTPTDFISASGYRNLGNIVSDGGQSSASSTVINYYAQKSIPTGSTATAVYIYASTTVSIEVFEATIIDGNSGSSLGSGTANSTITLSSSVAGDGEAYLTIKYDPTSITDYIYGGYITLT